MSDVEPGIQGRRATQADDRVIARPPFRDGHTASTWSHTNQDGIGRNTSALLLSVVPLIGFGSTLASGFLLERVKVTVILAQPTEVEGTRPGASFLSFDV